jgi:hypothetical protein
MCVWLLCVLQQNEDFFSQLVDRRQSLQLDDQPLPAVGQRRDFGSVPDLKLINSPSLTEITLCTSTSPSTKEESSDEEGGGGEFFISTTLC